MHPQDVCAAAGDRERNRGGGPPDPLPLAGRPLLGGRLPVGGALLARDVPDEGLSRHAEEQGGAYGPQFGQAPEELQVVIEALPKADAGVQGQPVGGDPRPQGRLHSLPEAPANLGQRVAVLRGRLHGLRRALAVHQDKGQVKVIPELGDRRDHLRVSQPAADVIDDSSARFDRAACHLGLGGVHRDGDRALRRESLDDGENAPQLLIRGDGGGPGSGGLAAYVQHIRALIDEVEAVLGRPLRSEELTAVREAIGGDVDDPHDGGRA